MQLAKITGWGKKSNSTRAFNDKLQVTHIYKIETSELT